jgi:hypothetical protein
MLKFYAGYQVHGKPTFTYDMICNTPFLQFGITGFLGIDILFCLEYYSMDKIQKPSKPKIRTLKVIFQCNFYEQTH